MLAMHSTKSELFNACRVIFGSEIPITVEFLHYLQPMGLKSAYRKRALETHPDRTRGPGTGRGDTAAQFRQVRRAYEILLQFLEGDRRRITHKPVNYAYTSKKQRRPHRPRTGAPRAHTRKRRSSDHYYSGAMPRRQLLLGQYLYYTGFISWRTLIRAVTWQRSQRPKMGQIAVQWGLLTHRDVVRILSERTLHEKFGECAKRIGYISGFEHIALIGKQRMLQRMIGEYFVERGLLTDRQMIRLLEHQKLHNRTVPK